MSHPYSDFVNILFKRFPNRVGLCEPEFKGNELKYLKECIDTGWVSTAGKYVTGFEEKIKELTGCNYAIATSTGTSALHTLYMAAGIHSEDEVLVQSFTFIATINAISYCGATPHFVDISEDTTLTIDPIRLKKYLESIAELKNKKCINKKTNKTIKALVVMHTFGKSSQMDECKKICDDFGLILLEDAAEALGTKYKDKSVGSLGLGGVFSFNGNKITTCGAGGVVVTNNEELSIKARHLSTTAKKPHSYLYEHDEIGYNYRMANINAAVGLAQLENFDKILEKKHNIYKHYCELFKNIKNFKMLGDEAWSSSNHWLNAGLLINSTYEQLLEVLKETNDRSILTRPAWTPMHLLKPYKDCPRDELSVTENKANSIICLPSSSFLLSS